MPVLDASSPDIIDFQPSLLLLIEDAFTGANILAGAVTVRIGEAGPEFQKDPQATFVFINLANGKYTATVRSAPDEPYYLPADIPITLPFDRPAQTLWPTAPNWPAYPDIVLADPSKMLDDPEQPAGYLAQRELAALLPTTSYPFPAGATLVRGVVRAGGTPLSGALVTTALLAQVGQFPLVVVNPSGAASNAQTLAVVSAPVIWSLHPATVLTGAALTLAVEGSGFVPGSVVQLNGVALPATFMSAAQIDANISAGQLATAGSLAVTVTNPDGTVSKTRMLTVAAAPAIDSLIPAAITAGSADFTLTVIGAAFAPGAVVELNGLPLATTYMSGTQLMTRVPAAQVANVVQLAVTMVNPGPPARFSNAATLAVVAGPVNSALDPAMVVAGSGAFALLVKGSGFLSGSVVQWNGVALATRLVSPTQLTAQVTAVQVTQDGQVSVTVLNPDASVSNGLTLTVTSTPAVDSIDPPMVAAGGNAFTLVVRGSGFSPGAVVRLNQTDLPTTFVNGGQLDAHVKRSGYTTGDDGTFVLFFNDIQGRGQTVTILAAHPRFPHSKSQDVTVQRGATVAVGIDMTP